MEKREGERKRKVRKRDIFHLTSEGRKNFALIWKEEKREEKHFSSFYSNIPLHLLSFFSIWMHVLCLHIISKQAKP